MDENFLGRQIDTWTMQKGESRVSRKARLKERDIKEDEGKAINIEETTLSASTF